MLQLDLLENSLKKRWNHTYNWQGHKQNDLWDSKTKFIYHARSFRELFSLCNNFDSELKNYAYNRWYNFWSAQGVEQIFSSYENVVPSKNRYNKLVDFTIDNTPFDHKSSVYPNGFNKPIDYAKKNEPELIGWLYKNQSQEGRKHFKNRLFLIFFDTINKEHWKLKAEVSLIQQSIDKYLKCFSIENLYTFDFGEGEVVSGIIWVIK
jgi:hypothetical protein